MTPDVGCRQIAWYLKLNVGVRESGVQPYHRDGVCLCLSMPVAPVTAETGLELRCSYYVPQTRLASW